jgi:hypothetical protein
MRRIFKCSLIVILLLGCKTTYPVVYFKILGVREDTLSVRLNDRELLKNHYLYADVNDNTYFNIILSQWNDSVYCLSFLNRYKGIEFLETSYFIPINKKRRNELSFSFQINDTLKIEKVINLKKGNLLEFWGGINHKGERKYDFYQFKERFDRE